MTIEIEKIQRLEVAPGEMLVVTLPAHSTPKDVQNARNALRDRLPDGVTFLVVTSGVELAVVARQAGGPE